MFHLKSDIQHMYIHYLAHKEIDDLYISVFIKLLAESFISIFLPVFLLKLGYGLNEIILFYMVRFITLSLFMYIFLHLCSIIGVKKVLAIGTVFLILTYFMLNFLDSGLNLFIPAIMIGLSTGSYYAAYHFELAKSIKPKKEAKSVSFVKIIAILTATLGPLIGAFIIDATSFAHVFIVASILLLISIIPLFFTSDFKVAKEKVNLKKIFKVDTSEKALSYQFEGFLHVFDLLFWPLFIYAMIGSISTLGRIVSFASLFMILFVKYVGKRAEKDPHKVLESGALIYSPIWLLKLLLITPIGLFISDLLNKSSRSMIELGFHKIVYADAGQRKDLISYFTFRQLNLLIGRILMFLIALACYFLIVDKSIYSLCQVLFIIAAFVTIVYVFLLKKIISNQHKKKIPLNN